MSKLLVLLLSTTTGVAIATIFLLQPLLQAVSQALGIPPEQIGMVATLTQAGYGFGILFLIPLGDILPKKKLILSKLCLLVLALILMALSTNFYFILISSLLIGIFGSTAQDVVPLAADLAPEEQRGAIVGQVMSGLLLGILLSRTVSGFVSDLLGWRSVFFVSAAVIAVVIVVLWIAVKSVAVSAKISYAELIKSTVQNFAIYPELRNSILVQSLIGLGFSAFWTNLSFYVGQEPFNMSTSQVGLFGLAGAAGALAAPIAGKLSDRRGPHLGILIGAALVTISFVVMWALPFSVPILFAGAVVFDLGVQMALVTHQTVVYSLNPAARSRLNALFVSTLFMAFAIGSLISVRLFAWGGWNSVLIFCVGSSFAAIALAVYQHRKKLQILGNFIPPVETQR